MEVLRHEFRKIVQFPALIGFVVLSLGLNIVFVTSMKNSYANFIAEASRITCVHLGADFERRAAELEPGHYTDMLRAQVAAQEDVLYRFSAVLLGDGIIEVHGLDGMPARLMGEKYRRFQYAVDARRQAGDSMTLYFAGATHVQHQRLFGYTMGLLLFQGVALASLMMLLSVGYEQASKTDYIVYATKVGRRVNRHKLVAGVVSALGAYGFLAAITLAVYFAANPMGGTWGSSVSSGFNYIRDGFATRPFVTWFGFTVWQYLLGIIGVSVGLVICFALMAYAVGLVVRNSYIGLLVVVGINGVMFVLPFFSPMVMLNYVLASSPVWLVLTRALWFTDGGANVLWPHFEIWGVGVSFVVLVLVAVLVGRRFYQVDVA